MTEPVCDSNTGRISVTAHRENPGLRMVRQEKV